MNKTALLFLLLISSVCFAEEKSLYKYELSACIIVQNEAPYLKEWIEFHKLVGFEHFYFYNNLSEDNLKEVLAPYVISGEVELREWNYDSISESGKYWHKIQLNAYNDAIAQAIGESKWLAILDSDEYLFPVQMDSLKEFLKDFEPYVAVTANWQMFGTSGIQKLSSDLPLIEQLILRAPVAHRENMHIKSILRPEFVRKMVNAHCAYFYDHQRQVTPDKITFKGPFTEVKVDKLRINHYWTRDEDYLYNVKLPRREKLNDKSTLDRAEKINKELDTSIYKYLPALKQALGL